jgi:hypothetical protein
VNRLEQPEDFDAADVNSEFADSQLLSESEESHTFMTGITQWLKVGARGPG